MNFYSAYLRTLFWKPQDAVVAMYWWCTGRKVRARNRLRLVAEQSPSAYQRWIETTEREQDAAAPTSAIIAGWHQRPRVSIILHRSADAHNKDMARLLALLSAQNYPDWELVVVSDRNCEPIHDDHAGRLVAVAQCPDDAAQALALGIERASGAYIMPHSGDATLSAVALSRYVEALQANPGAIVVYGDQDRIDAHGTRSTPWFKPRWNAEMLLAQDYISAACLIGTEAARAVLPLAAAPPNAAVYALLLAITQPEMLTPPVPAGIIHLPHILAHLTDREQADDQPARVAAVARHLGPAAAMVSAGPFATVRVDWPLPEPLPPVSIIIPTRDHWRLLKTCVHGVLTATRYRNFEVIIVDNGSREPETLAYLTRVADDPRVRVLPYHRPFNFSAINNLAARAATGSYLCLLNNDIEIIDEDWLGALMRQAVRPEVGAAGAKLLYEDGTVQHAGVVIGLGGAAGHAHRFQRNSAAGYFARAHVAHSASAVTAACLVVDKAKYDAVGGFDEAEFAVAFNDVDLCLKLERAGWHNIFVPQAMAIHHESKSRGRDFLPANIDRYRSERAVLQERWATKTYQDPLHHPQLDSYSENYLIYLKV